jgi:hypothetical protein
LAAADTVMFAIEGGLRLYGAIRKSYVDATRGRPLVLPLPRSKGIDFSSARTWFGRDGAAVLERYPRAAELMEREDLDESEKRELTELYRAIRTVTLPEEAEAAEVRGLISEDELCALVTVRQWADGKFGPEPTALQQIAGTIVNISVDYFLQTPGTISEHHPAGRTLRSFLEILDTTDFASVAVTDLAPGLLVAALQSVAGNPDLVSGGEKEQLLVRSVLGSLASNAQSRLVDATAAERADASLWLQLIARSLIDGGAGTILANPTRFFAVEAGEADLISRVGGVVVDLLVGEHGVRIRPLVSADGLDTVVRAILEAVAANPELVDVGNEGLRNVVVAVAEDLAAAPEPLSPDVFPDLVSLILARTAENMELIIGRELDDPHEHLLVTAVSTLLAELARVHEGEAKWRPRLTSEQLLAVADAVFDEVIDNPAWLIERAAEDTVLAETIRAVVDALKDVDERRVSAQTGLLIIRSGLQAVARRLDFLDELPPVADEQARKALTAAIDAVLETIFAEDGDPDTSWNLARNSAVLAITEVVLQELSDFGVAPEQIEVVREVVRDNLQSGEPLRIEEFAEDLQRRLAA